MSIPLGDDAAQRHPFMEAIVADTRLPLGRELFKLAYDGARDAIGSRRH